MDLKIMQINIRSLKHNIINLQCFVSSHNIDVICVCETWLPKPTDIYNSKVMSIKNFNAHHYPREDGYGGVSILTKKNIIVKTKNHPDLLPLEVCEAQLFNAQGNLIIVSVYIPPELSSGTVNSKFNKLCQMYYGKNNVLIAGDLNAHHHLWNFDNNNNTKGNHIAESITKSDFVVLNDGSHTYEKFINKRLVKSAIDVSFCSPDLANIINWKRVEEFIGSDHLPLVISIHNSSIVSTKSVVRVNHVKAMDSICSLKAEHTFDIEDYLSELEARVKTATIIDKLSALKRTPKPWWNGKIKQLWIIKTAKQRIHNKFKTFYTSIQLKKATAILKNEIRMAKSASWARFVDDINPMMNNAEIWRRIKCINGKHNRDYASIIGDKKSIDEFLNLNFKKNRQIDRQKSIKDLSPEFTVDAIIGKISKLKKSAPGHDNISNCMLKALPLSHIVTLTNHLNKMWQERSMPSSWKKFKAFPLPKPGKDKTIMGNYRPLTLISTTCKLANSIIKDRISDYIETNSILPENSFGFRKGRSTQDYILKLIENIGLNKLQNKNTIAIVMDLEKAFDNVNTRKLLQIMDDLGIEDKYIDWTQEFLSNRQYIVSSDDVSSHLTTSDGVPQGSVLSPLLFNIYTSTIHEDTDDEIILQFADDITILVSGDVRENLNRKCELAINRFINKIKNLDLNINPSKCRVLKFVGFDRKKLNTIKVFIDDKEIEVVNSHRILGITIDNKLNFNRQVKNLKDACNSGLNILKVLSGPKRGVHPKVMLRAFNALVISKLIYGTKVINLSNSNLQILQKIQNRGLRTCLGLCKSTPITAIISEAGTLPMKRLLERHTIKYITKILDNNKELASLLKNDKIKLKINETLHCNSTLFDNIYFNKTAPKSPTNLKIFSNLPKMNGTKADYPAEMLRSMTMEHLESFSRCFQIFTDGSVDSTKGAGVGIYIKDSEESIAKRLQRFCSIKTCELIAIFLAIKYAVIMNKLNIVILTDSRSACESLTNSVNKNSKYFEGRILDVICDNQNVNFVIQWVPAHVNVFGNEKADAAAKAALESNLDCDIIRNKITIEDSNLYVKQMLLSKWSSEYNEKTINKGMHQYKVMGGVPSYYTWFRDCDLNSADTKLICRIRSGHTYDNRFKKMMRLIDCDKCDRCDVQENIEHILIICDKYANQRNQFHNLNIATDLATLLNKNELVIYQEIINFLNMIKISV